MTGLRRRLALCACALIGRALPRGLQTWADAIRSEVSAIESDAAALAFALDSLRSVVWRSAAFHLLRLLSAITGSETASPEGPLSMMLLDQWRATPRNLGALCAIGATALGLALMAVGGAPAAYLVGNLGALVIGLLLFANINHAGAAPGRWGGLVMLAAGLALVATALFGLEADGNTRWIRLGPIALQPGLMLVPVMVVAFVRRRSRAAAWGMIAAAAALALQPDRAMAAALAAGMLALLVRRRDSLTIPVAIAAIAGFVITVVRPDGGQAAPFVDRVIVDSFALHWLAGTGMAGGLALLLLPAVAGIRLGGEMRDAALVFGASWAAVIVASALGNYPAPLVGYSGAAVLGYVLSLAMLPGARPAQKTSPLRIRHGGGADAGTDGVLMLEGA